MIRTILVPLDGSPAAEQALPWARSLARRSGAAVKLVRVRMIPPTLPTGEGMAAYNPDALEATQAEENNYMAQTARRWKDDDAQTTLTGDLLEPNDSIAGMLVDFAEKNQTDLTIMTTHGRGPVSRFLFGSTADEYLRRAPCPTLLLRADAPLSESPTWEPSVSRVIVPLDGSPLSEQAVTPALTLFDWFGCEITLLLVLEAVENLERLLANIDATASYRSPQSALPVVEEYLQRVADRLRRQNSKVSVKVIERGSAAETILAEASHPDTAVAMATHGQGGLSRMIFGSVADKVIRGATGPVLVVRPKSGA